MKNPARTTKPRRPGPNSRPKPREQYDVIIVGGGPAGSVLAWELAGRGVKVLLMDRAHFPREKVCGDYIEPRGLRVLEKMGCLRTLEADSPLPIAYSATFVNSQCRYRGRIPFYGVREGLPPHGYIIRRERLDYVLLETAAKSGATVLQGTLATAVTIGSRGVAIEALRGKRRVVYQGRLVVGADGVNSIVARSAGLLAGDPRHTAVSQRAYADGIDGEIGEASFYFDNDFFPGYGWMFPMSGGIVNLGVGILSETAQRLSINIPRLFNAFLETVKRSHHRSASLQLCQRPIGGIVKTYGGAGPNHFDGGLLIGDAGCFVDPMTGEGITPAMESALIAAPVIVEALSTGRFEAGSLSAYEKGFRAYFDPSMVFLDLVACAMRNRHMGESWLKLMIRGCALAQSDPSFARTTGAAFGGLEIDPPGILSQVWTGMARELVTLGPWSLASLDRSGPSSLLSAMGEAVGWQLNWWKSVFDNPIWHASWALDMEQKWLRFASMMTPSATDPRAAGLV